MKGVHFFSLRGNRGRGLSTVVDAESSHRLGLLREKMYLHSKGYVCLKRDGKVVLLHRLIAGNDTRCVDHANRDMLNNRVSNLRICTDSQNLANRPAQRNNTSGFKGVTRVGKRWKAEIKCGMSKRHLGCFATKEQAALRYNEVASELFGEFAYRNEVTP